MICSILCSCLRLCIFVEKQTTTFFHLIQNYFRMLKKNVYWNLWRSKIRAFLKTKDIYPAKMSTHRSAITQLVDVQFSTFFFGRQHIVTSSVFTKRDDELALVLNQVSHNSVAL